MKSVTGLNLERGNAVIEGNFKLLKYGTARLCVPSTLDACILQILDYVSPSTLCTGIGDRTAGAILRRTILRGNEITDMDSQSINCAVNSIDLTVRKIRLVRKKKEEKIRSSASEGQLESYDHRKKQDFETTTSRTWWNSHPEWTR